MGWLLVAYGMTVIAVALHARSRVKKATMRGITRGQQMTCRHLVLRTQGYKTPTCDQCGREVPSVDVSVVQLAAQMVDAYNQVTRHACRGEYDQAMTYRELVGELRHSIELLNKAV